MCFEKKKERHHLHNLLTDVPQEGKIVIVKVENNRIGKEPLLMLLFIIYAHAVEEKQYNSSDYDICVLKKKKERHILSSLYIRDTLPNVYVGAFQLQQARTNWGISNQDCAKIMNTKNPLNAVKKEEARKGQNP